MGRRPLTIPAFLILTMFLALLPACMAGTLTEEEPFTRTLAVTGQKSLEIRNTNGSIHVTGWDRNEVRVDALKKASDRATLQEIRIDIETTPEKFVIRVQLPKRRGFFQWGPGASASFDLKVPRTLALDLESTNGGLQVTDLRAPVRLRTTNGSLKADRVRGDLRGETTNGSVVFRAVTGDVDVRTTNGKVTLSEITGCTRARSTNGSIEARVRPGDRCERLYFRTTNGSIFLQTDPAVLRRIEAHASNGRIRVRLPDRSLEMERRRRVEVDLGPTGTLLELTTTNGSITVEQAS